ncbi:gem-associated protein 5 [Aphomia sociella]
MDETILYPSPNWFQVSGFTVTNDGWLVYGGPCKSLCVLEPVPLDIGVFRENQSYRTHVFNRAHNDKITSVDVSLDWPSKRAILTGSADGSVKEWMVDQVENKWRIKPTQSHEVHVQEKEEVAGVGYCNSTIAASVGSCGHLVKWDLNSNVAKTCNILKNMKPTCMSCSQHQPLHVAVGTKQGVIFVVDLHEPFKLVYKVRGQDDEITYLSWCPQLEVIVKKDWSKNLSKKVSPSDRLKKIGQKVTEKPEESEVNNKQKNNHLEESGVIKTLPDDSFDLVAVVQEDGPFDIYKDHETNEFGHKKYVPEEVTVKVQKEEKEQDFLEECKSLKSDILKRKNEPEASIESLVQALDKTHVENGKNGEVSNISTENVEASEKGVTSQTYKHLLVTIGKYGSVRVWSKSGKLVGSCAVSSIPAKQVRSKSFSWTTVLWYTADVLLIADARSQLLMCNPLELDCKNKLDYEVLHSLHKRGLFCIASSAPRVQIEDLSLEEHPIWTVSQDRTFISYSLATRKTISEYGSCGGFPYTILPCPYDAGRFAASVGDGAVRVWDTSAEEEEGPKMSSGRVMTYWQNVQGKVLTIAWHPLKENLLAFATAESRVGLIDASPKVEKSARVLMPSLNGGVYSLYWGENDHLYACGGGVLVVYNANKPDEAPVPINVKLEGQEWEMSTGRWFRSALMVGSRTGAIAALEPKYPHKLIAATFVFNKMIHTIDWHPDETTHATEESPYKNLIAVCALDKDSKIVILDYSDDKDGVKQFQTWKTLSGHKAPVLQVIWNPHADGQLMSTSQDGTIRLWDIAEGACISIFGGHSGASLSAAWVVYPHLDTKVLSGGGDCSLRIWDTKDFPADSYIDIKNEVPSKREKRKKEKKETKETKDEIDEEEADMLEEKVAATQESKLRAPKKFMLPTLHRQINKCSIQSARKLLRKYLQKTAPESCEVQSDAEINGHDETIDFTKIFGSNREMNDTLTKESRKLLIHGCVESFIMLNIFRGDIDQVMLFAAKRDLLCPFVLSLAPGVSLKYWKDISKQYISQMDRLIARGEGERILMSRSYGGPVYRKTATLLTIHDIKNAVEVLKEARMYLEAYVLCRTRFMDSIAEDTLKQWAQFCTTTGVYHMAGACYIALGNLSEAATVIAKSNEEEWLSLAAELAKMTGQNTFGDHIIEKREQLKKSKAEVKTDPALDQLPQRFEALMKDAQREDETNENDEKATTNGV